MTNNELKAWIADQYRDDDSSHRDDDTRNIKIEHHWNIHITRSKVYINPRRTGEEYEPPPDTDKH